MYSIICLFLWLPHHYNFRVAIANVFNITADQIVSLRKQRQNNIVIFKVASQEIFNSLSEFFCRILFLPILGENILECFAFPNSPQYQFLRLSADIEDIEDVYLSRLGTVLYRRYLSYTLRSTSVFRTDRIGVVLRRKNDTNDSAEPALGPCTSRLGPEIELEDTAAARTVPNTPFAGRRSGGTSHLVAQVISALGLQQPSSKPEWLHYLETDMLQSEFNYQHQGSQIGTFQADVARLCSRNTRQHWGQCSHGNYSPSMGLSSPAKAPVKGKRASQKPSPKDEHPSSPAQVPKEKGSSQEPSPKDEHPSSLAQAAIKEKGASQELSPKDENPSENSTAKDQHPKSSSGENKQE